MKGKGRIWVPSEISVSKFNTQNVKLTKYWRGIEALDAQEKR